MIIKKILKSVTFILKYKVEILFKIQKIKQIRHILGIPASIIKKKKEVFAIPPTTKKIKNHNIK